MSGKSIASFVGDELSFLKLGSVLVGFHLGGGVYSRSSYLRFVGGCDTNSHGGHYVNGLYFSDQAITVVTSHTTVDPMYWKKLNIFANRVMQKAAALFFSRESNLVKD